MTDHMWVSIQYTPIDVELQDDGTLHTFTTEMGEELARIDSSLGCWNCNAPLTTESFGTECPSSK